MILCCYKRSVSFQSKLCEKYSVFFKQLLANTEKGYHMPLPDKCIYRISIPKCNMYWLSFDLRYESICKFQLLHTTGYSP